MAAQKTRLLRAIVVGASGGGGGVGDGGGIQPGVESKTTAAIKFLGTNGRKRPHNAETRENDDLGETGGGRVVTTWRGNRPYRGEVGFAGRPQ